MPLFNSNSKLEILNQIKEIPFQLERQIQHLVEANLNTLLGLEFVKSEFTISGSVQRLRIDTLAFDRKNKAFVIIEYKQDKNFSVVDQGYAYLSAMLNNKADFILEYNDARNEQPGDAERKRGAERARLCPDGSDHPVYDAGRKGKPFHPQCQQKKADRSRIGSAGL